MKRTRCYSCTRLNHLGCERRLDDDARCICRCVGTDGRMEYWALIETGRHNPSALASHAAVAGSLHICWAKAGAS